MSANGYLTAAELTSIGHGLLLRNDAAAGWFSARDEAAENDHINIDTSATASAYRPWAMQLDMRAHPGLYGINPNLNGLPGLPSRHGLGIARDVPFGAPNNWMIQHGNEHGWSRPAATMAIGDTNHWEFTPGTATAGSGATPTTTTGTDEMKLIYNAESGMVGLVGGSNGYDELGKADALGEQLTALEQVYGPKVALTDTYFQVNKKFAFTTALVIPAASAGGGSVVAAPVDLQPILDAIHAIPAAPTTFVAKA